MKIAIPDLISNSYFPAIAAVKLGLFKAEGLDVDLELVVPVEKAMDALKDGSLEFLGCSSHLVVGEVPTDHAVSDRDERVGEKRDRGIVDARISRHAARDQAGRCAENLERQLGSGLGQSPGS